MNNNLIHHFSPSLLIQEITQLPQTWSLTPVNGNKRPYRKGWQSEESVDHNQIINDIQSKKAQGIGIRTGIASNGIMAVDVDGQAAHERLVSLGRLPETVAFTSGKSGRCQYLLLIDQQYWEAIATKKIRTGIKGEKGKEQLLELRWNGCQSVLPPSKHPDTGVYKWINSPQDIEVAEAPIWLIDQMLKEKKCSTFIPGNNIYEPIPLYNCLPHSDRSLIDGGANKGSRNDAACRLSLNLVATEDWLQRNAIPYEQTARELYGQFCSRCNPPLGSDIKGEEERWIRGAENRNDCPSLPDDAIMNCVNAWQNRTRARSGQGFEVNESTTNNQQLQEQSLIDEAESLKRDVKRYSTEKDPANRAIILKNLRKQGYGINQVQEIANDLEDGYKAPKAEFFTPQEFMDFVPEGLTWLFPGILPKRGIVILAGSPGIGKSILAYDAAASLLLGEEFLGEMPNCRGKVLFVLSDESEIFIQDKLINRGFYASDNWGILNNWDLSQWEILESTLEKNRPDLVIVDSFSSIHRGSNFDENSSQAKLSLFSLDDLLGHYNAAGLMIHHTNKNREQKGVNKLRGSSAIAATASMVWLLSGDDKIKNFSTPKVRGTPPLKLNLALDPEHGHYKVLGGDEELKACKPVIQRVKSFFEENGHDTRYEIEEIMQQVGGSRETIYQSLHRLSIQGVVAKRPSFKDPRRKVYYLSPKYKTHEKVDTSPSPTINQNLSNILPENHAHQGVDMFDKIVDTSFKTVDEIFDNPSKNEILTYSPA